MTGTNERSVRRDEARWKMISGLTRKRHPPILTLLQRGARRRIDRRSAHDGGHLILITAGAGKRDLTVLARTRQTERCLRDYIRHRSRGRPSSRDRLPAQRSGEAIYSASERTWLLRQEMMRRRKRRARRSKSSGRRATSASSSHRAKARRCQLGSRRCRKDLGAAGRGARSIRTGTRINA